MVNLSKTDRMIILIYLCLNIFVVAAVRINPTFGLQLLQEDESIENLTSIALFAASFYVLFRCFQSLAAKKFLWSFIQLLLAIALFFMAGEEISWGQRIFHWETTGMFKKDNLQGETNFHNLKIDGVKLNKVIFTYGFTAIGAFVFVICPFLYKKYTGFKNFVNRFGSPLPAYKQSLFLLIGLLFVLLVPDDSKQWELWECNAAVIIFWTMLRPLNVDVIYKKSA